jgi:hypothetical protein
LPADSALPDGTDNDNITVTGNNLLNSLGQPTNVGFTISPVGGDDAGDPAGTDPTSPNALFGQYVFVGSAGQTTGTSTFTISGLGSESTADLYFYYGANPNISISGATKTTFAPNGIFTVGNTLYFKGVAVTNGTVNGTFGSGPVSVLYGLTIAPTAAGPGPKLSISRQGTGVVIAWPGTGTLQSTSTIGGTWAPVQGGATSPYTVTPTGKAQFYRLQQ